MTLTELRYITAVAKEGHFGRAAKACFVSQPTLSLGIKRLEDELGVVIFERGNKELVITPLGKKIIERAESVLREVKGVKNLAKTANDPFHEPLRIGAIHTVGPYLFPSLFPIIRRNAPQMPLLVEENFTVNLAERLRNGDIDLAILSLPFSEPGIDTHVLYHEPFVAVLPVGHPLAAKDAITVKDLDEQTVLLLGPQHCFRDQVLELCPNCAKTLAENDNLQSMLQGSSIETLRYMVASGVGVTVLPITAACVDRYKHGFLAIRPLDSPDSGRTIALAWRSHYVRLEAVKLIVDSVRQCSLENVKIVAAADVGFDFKAVPHYAFAAPSAV